MSKPVKMFEKAAFGYRPEDVDNHISELNSRISALEAEKEEQMAKMRILAEKINEYRKEESDLKDALLGAQKMANNVLNEAKSRADMILTDAKSRADRLVYDAQKQSEETIGAIQMQTEREKMTLVKMQKEVSDFKATLVAVYKRHLNVITALPEMDEEAAAFYEEKLGGIKEESAQAEPAIEEVSPQSEVEEENPAVAEAEEESAANDDASSNAPDAANPSEEAQPSEEVSSTRRFDKVQSTPRPAFSQAPKPSFEEKFGELKFGKNNSR